MSYFTLVSAKQCCGSVSFLYGSGSSDPFREITDPDPAPDSDPAKYHLSYHIFFYKKIYFSETGCVLLFVG